MTRVASGRQAAMTILNMTRISGSPCSSALHNRDHRKQNDDIGLLGSCSKDDRSGLRQSRKTVVSGQRTVLLAVGAALGETRAVDNLAISAVNTSTTWAVTPELRLEGERFGFQGEAFAGEAMGTYNGAIGQSLNPNDGESIYSVGGFGEVFWKMNPCFTASVGYAIDAPRDRDLGTIGGTVGQRAGNESYWVNFIWRLSDNWETRFDVS